MGKQTYAVCGDCGTCLFHRKMRTEFCKCGAKLSRKDFVVVGIEPEKESQRVKDEDQQAGTGRVPHSKQHQQIDDLLQ